MSYLRRSYPSHAPSSTSPSQAIEDSKKKTSLLKDSSWIRRDNEEDEPVDRDPNFGRTVLSQYKSNENLHRSPPEEPKRPKVRTPSSSVQALTKRFSASQDELDKSSTSLSWRSDAPKTTTTSKTIVTEEPKKSTTSTTVTKDGKTTETTTTTTTIQRVSSTPMIKTSPKTETFTERVFSDVKSSGKGITPYSSYSPPKTTKVTETTVVTSNKEAEDQLYDKLLPKSITDDFPTTDSKTTVSKTETVKTSTDGDGVKITTTTRTSSMAEDELYDILLPKSMTSDLPSPVSTTSTTKRDVFTVVDSAKGGDSPTAVSPTSPRTITSDDYTSTRRSYTSRQDSSSPTRPSVYTTTSYKKSSSADDLLADPFLSASSIKTVYSAPERTVLEKDLCTYCRKPFNSEAKMILEDMKINCHASCFKCEACNVSLGHLKAGDSLWIYRRNVQCERCFDITREKWRR